LSLFAISLYNIYSREIHASWIETMEQEVIRLTPQSEKDRVEEAFQALSTINETSGLNLTQIGRLNWIYLEASSDGAFSRDEVDALLTEIRAIAQSKMPVRRL
jgi:hypothetical protein